jgi:hypothetical protein
MKFDLKSMFKSENIKLFVLSHLKEIIISLVAFVLIVCTWFVSVNNLKLLGKIFFTITNLPLAFVLLVAGCVISSEIFTKDTTLAENKYKKNIPVLVISAIGIFAILGVLVIELCRIWGKPAEELAWAYKLVITGVLIPAAYLVYIGLNMALLKVFSKKEPASESEQKPVESEAKPSVTIVASASEDSASEGDDSEPHYKKGPESPVEEYKKESGAAVVPTIVETKPVEQVSVAPAQEASPEVKPAEESKPAQGSSPSSDSSVAADLAGPQS